MLEIITSISKVLKDFIRGVPAFYRLIFSDALRCDDVCDRIKPEGGNADAPFMERSKQASDTNRG